MAQLIDRILANVGKADAGERRDLVFADLKDLLKVDLPRAGGGAFAKGTTSLSIGVTGSVREDGTYQFPRTLRSFGAALQFVDDPTMPTPAMTFIDPRFVYTDPFAFYQMFKYGNAQSDSDYGKPSSILLDGRTITLRPIPKQTAVATPWWGLLVIGGTTYLDVDSLVEADQCPRHDYEPALVAEGTRMEAVRQQREDALALYSPLAILRRDELGAVSLATMTAPLPAKDF